MREKSGLMGEWVRQKSGLVGEWVRLESGLMGEAGVWVGKVYK